MQAGYRLTKQEVLHIATQVANGMAAIHANGVVHCDLKPQNILVKPVEGRSASEEEHRRYIYGTYKITDFGHSLNVGEEPPMRHGNLIGTLP
jgi:serine/threonine protein kinase